MACAGGPGRKWGIHPSARRAARRTTGSLSPPIHALAAARLGDLPTADRYLRQTAAIDLDDAYGNAAGGVHIGAACLR